MSVNPSPGINSQTAASPVVAINPLPNGGTITNPVLAADQGIATAEPLFIDPVGNLSVMEAHGTVFAIEPGQSWTVIPGQSTPTYVHAATPGHKFSVVSW